MSAPVTVLIADDNPDDRTLVVHDVRRVVPGARFVEVLDDAALARAIEQGGFDLVVSDFQLRWTDGLAVLRRVKERWPEVPVILFTGTGSEEVAVEAMKSGLDDYVLKSPKHRVRLPAAVRAALERAREARAAREVGDRLARAEQKLVQAQKLEAVGRLAAGIAHDFNNLLTVILGHAELLGDDPDLGPKRRRSVECILQASARAAELTQQLLAFSRRQVLAPRPVDVRAALEEAERFLRPAVGSRISLSLDVAPDTGWVRIDPTQLSQVLLNLALNARDAMPGGGELAISASAIDLQADDAPNLARGRYVSIRVRDAGTGMDAETQSHLFEPFFTTKDPGDGTGLGLATVHGIVEQSGGSVRVESELGQGSTFEVLLPHFAVPAAIPQRPQAALARAARTSAASVLVVQEDAAIRDLATQALAGAGHEVVTAPDAEAALALVAGGKRPIDLVVIDVDLRGHPGPTLAAELRRARPRLRVLFVSGFGDRELARRGELEPGEAFLRKPFTSQTLVEKVGEVLAREPSLSDG